MMNVRQAAADFHERLQVNLVATVKHFFSRPIVLGCILALLVAGYWVFIHTPTEDNNISVSFQETQKVAAAIAGGLKPALDEIAARTRGPPEQTRP